MTRNANSHFAVNPTSLDIGRSRWETSFNHTSTGNFGDLIPFFWTEILPGDTLSVKTSKVIRMLTMLDPVFGNAFCDVYYFFVPMRLVWEHTKEFFGENTTGPWYPSTTYTIPKIKTTSSNPYNVVATQTVADYMGVPPGVSGLEFSALPIRAYCKSYSDWFMDETVQTPPNIPLNDTTVNYTTVSPEKGGYPYQVCKYHDYFTSCTPSAQRGPAVTIPLSGTVPVSISGTAANIKAAVSSHSTVNPVMFGSTNGYTMRQSGFINGEADLSLTNGDYSGSNTQIDMTNLYAEWPSSGTVNLNGALPITVSDLRMAFQTQKFYEKSALFGGRYIELIRAQFGVVSPDARLQRSEYLGGNRCPIHIEQIENTAESSSVPLGKLGAISHTSDSNEDFTHSFTEHGFVIGVMACRYLHQYPQGLWKPWSRSTLLDHYFPVFANISNQPCFVRELYATGTATDSNVFGYQEAWSEYRYMPDRVSGKMRPGITGSLSSWTWADYYTNVPTLSSAWIKEDKTNVDRSLAVPSTTQPQLLFDINVDMTWVRAMPLYSIPGLIDHH